MDLDTFLGVERTGWSYLAETPDSPQLSAAGYEEERQQEEEEGGEGLERGKEGEEEGLASVSVLEWADDARVPLNVTTWYGMQRITIFCCISTMFNLLLR